MKYFDSLSSASKDAIHAFLASHGSVIDPSVSQNLGYVFYCSDYAYHLFSRYPELFLQFARDKDYRKPIRSQHIEQSLADRLQKSTNIDDIYASLRHFRHLHHLRILMNDLLGFFSISDTMRQLSAVSDCIIRQAAQYVHQKYCQDYSLNHYQIAPLTIIAVGKLGGNDLNFSSDIDLILSYPEEWIVADLSASYFYHKQAKLFINLLSLATTDGFVYRVDLRLRPFGEEGALLLPYSGLENYYENAARSWERYALLKSRILYGDQIERAEKIINDFVYPPKVSEDALKTLAKLKRLIEREVLSRQLQDDIKRGPGGIRQIEFIVQLFQLIYGYDEIELRTSEWPKALHHLRKINLISKKQLKLLKKSYYFLREIEHNLQIYRDEQTHLLPKKSEEQDRLTASMDYPAWARLEEDIQLVRKEMNDFFESLFKIGPDIPHHSKKISPNHYKKNRWKLSGVQEFLMSDFYKNLPDTNRNFCIKLLMTLEENHTHYHAHLVDSFIDLLEAIAKHTGYFSLFDSEPQLTQLVINLFNQSPWCARSLSQFPALLYEIASMRPLSQAMSVRKLSDELRQMMLSIPEDDTMQIAEGLRKFKLRQYMRVAYSDMNQTLALMQVSDHLTFTAETIVKYLSRHVIQSMIKAHPDINETIFQSFSIIAYGKLGSIELSYQSDLDLIFFYQADLEYGPLFTRLVQRIIDLLEKPMLSGKLYEVDTRLRPSGHMLVNTFTAFADYLEKSAWTWEYQSLIRARFIVGEESLCEKFNTIRKHALTQKRDVIQLRHEVSDMRQRLTRQNLFHHFSEVYSQVSEAVKDIEFIVQFLCLAYAADHPEIIKWSDNIRILEVIAEKKIIPSENAQRLITAYQGLRKKLHEYTLKESVDLDDETRQCISFVHTQKKALL